MLVHGRCEAGKNGFPELPAVSTMLSDAAQTLTGSYLRRSSETETAGDVHADVELAYTEVNF